ncbi:hypothetical protein ASF54_02845 [Frondihabitans sp. Leaf304]|nr:hypothetical protein ASF54_02845 [Frondihabitans sp. Leaf304]
METMLTAPRLLAVRTLPAALAVLLLAGCTGAAPAASSSPTAPRASATPTGGAGALTATPLTVDCQTIAPDATVSAAYPGMTPEEKPTPPKASDAAVIGGYDGTVCGWTSTTGSSMTLAVGRFDNDSLTRLKNSLITSSNAVPTYDGEGYFDLVDGVGTAEAFTGSYWIVATSDDAVFGEPGGAEPLVDAAIAGLK